MLNKIDRDLKLKLLYFYTMISTIIFGLVVIIAPDLFFTLTDMPIQDQLIFGIIGSVWIAFGISSIFGLKAPMKFVPVLLMQFLYKVIWILGVFLPQTIIGNGGMYSIILLIVFLTYVIPDLLFIPWKELLKNE